MSKASSKSKTAITLAAIITVLIVSVAAAGSVKIAYSQSSNTPDFSLKTLDGKLVSLESFKGKPLVLWFMATWCPSCVGQASAIKQVSSEYGNKLNVLVIDLWAAQNICGQSAQGFNAETGSDLQAFIAKYGSQQWNGTSVFGLIFSSSFIKSVYLIRLWFPISFIVSRAHFLLIMSITPSRGQRQIALLLPLLLLLYLAIVTIMV